MAGTFNQFKHNGTPLDGLGGEYNGLNQILEGQTPCATGRYFVYDHGQEVTTPLAQTYWEAIMPWQGANAISTGYFYKHNEKFRELKLIHAGNMPRAITGNISSSGFSKYSGNGYLIYNYMATTSSTSISITRYSDSIKIGSNYYTTSSFHTSTIPNNLLLVACGAGGGGAGGNGSNGNYYYGGGGGGGGGIGVIVLDVLNYTFTITIGAAGSGGAMGYNGSKGGDTIIKSYPVGSSTLAGTYTLTGGSGGTYSAGTGGSGGLPSINGSNGMYNLYTMSGAKGGNGGSSVTGSLRYASKGNNFSWEFDPVLYDNGSNPAVLDLGDSSGGAAYTTHRCNGGGGGGSLAPGGKGSSNNTSGAIGYVGSGGGGGGLAVSGQRGGGGAVFIFY